MNEFCWTPLRMSVVRALKFQDRACSLQEVCKWLPYHRKTAIARALTDLTEAKIVKRTGQRRLYRYVYLQSKRAIAS